MNGLASGEKRTGKDQGKDSYRSRWDCADQLSQVVIQIFNQSFSLEKVPVPEALWESPS